MAGQAICCGECSLPVPPESWNRGAGRCRGCGQTILAGVFPAIEIARVGASPEALEIETEASCFYHPASRAAVPCDECGRFLCKLCDLEIGGRHLCPQCFQSGAASEKIQNVVTSRTMYDSIAIALVTWPVVFWPVMLISGPAALFVIIRRWRAPGSIVPRTRVRYYIAGVLALAEMTGVVFLIWIMFYAVLFQGRRST